MHTVSADLTLCEGYANCVIAAPTYFDVDDDEGMVVVLKAEVPEQDLAEVESAVRSCPVSALTLKGE